MTMYSLSVFVSEREIFNESRLEEELERGRETQKVKSMYRKVLEDSSSGKLRVPH